MQEMIHRFTLEGTPVSCIPFGSGHINETWLAVTNRPHLYILQKVNTNTFRDPEGLMRNIRLVTQHLKKKDPDPRHSLTLVPLKDGREYLISEDGMLWRMYEYVTGGICLEKAETAEDIRQSGKAFGLFQQQLADFPAEQLAETIPKFHDTPARFEALHAVIREDRENRVKTVRKELDFLMEREGRAGYLLNLMKAGDLPVRVTHNDTKLNNVILDEQTREPLCIVDLDTVMPGLAATDFGDAIRFGASTAAEDEQDLSKVHLSLDLYRAYAEGFLSVCGNSLSDAEKETLPDGAWMMTLEVGLRFLTDYLAGDTYFHIDRPGHNLDRARTQFALAAEMEHSDAQIRGMLAQVISEMP